MKSKKIISLLLAATCVFGLTACGSTESSTAASTGSAAAETSAAEAKTETKASGLQIAIPNDTTNEARALLLLQDLGYIKLKDGAGITATIKLTSPRIPYDLEFSGGWRPHSFPTFCRMWTTP